MALKSCPCGSGKEPWVLNDARGISCGYVCEVCEAVKKAKYRPEIFTNTRYATSEPIEEDGEPEYSDDY